MWSLIGALSEALPGIQVATMVTCPTFRIHPVVLAQAAVTSAVVLDGRFVFGIGTGENLDEHVTGLHLPPAEERTDRLREAVDVMRRLWDGGSVDFDGRYYRAVSARIYTLPDEPPPVYVSGFGPAATLLAAEIDDGFVTLEDELLEEDRRAGGRGPVQTLLKACYDRDEANANAIEIACGASSTRHLQAMRARARAGDDEVYVQQVGPDMDGSFSFYTTEVLPSARRLAAA